MKQLLTTLAIVIATSMVGQSYSTFYGTYDVNQNVNVNKNVNVSGTVNQNVNKTVTTIDYGALAAANAQQEANRLNAMQYTDSRDAMISKEIAADPFAAFKYGKRAIKKYNRAESRKYFKEEYGHFPNRVHWEWTAPSTLLFSSTGFGKFRNTSSDGSIETEIIINTVTDYAWSKEKFGARVYPESITSSKKLAEQRQKWYPEGATLGNNEQTTYTHKSEIGTAKVYRKDGYVWTWIYETDYDYVIRDSYVAIQEGLLYDCRIQYKVSKSRGTFEDLEGRRYYLRRLGEEIIATAYFRYY